jgi:hypothetical protein
MRHVGPPSFAVIVCRKFATGTAFSWHFPLRFVGIFLGAFLNIFRITKKAQRVPKKDRHTRERGVSSMPQGFASITGVSEYLITRFRG